MRPTASSTRDRLGVMAHRLLAVEYGVGADLGRHPLPEDIHLDPRSGSKSDRQIAVGDVAPDGESIRAAAQSSDDRTIGIDGLATINREVLLVADQQGAETPPDPGGLGGHERVPPIEIALVEADAEAEPGLQRIVQQGEVGAVVAVTLLHPQRVQRSVAARPNAKRSPAGHQAIPDLHRDTGLEIELPPQLADIRHALGEYVESGYPNVASLHEREAFLGDVVVGNALQHLAGLRS